MVGFLPALLLTLVLDKLGIWLTGGMGYNGEFYDVYNSGPQLPVAVSHSVVTFLGNVAFLQTIYVPPFGTNGPIWSLANEFWYYITFPLACWAICAKRIKFTERAAGLGILGIILLLLPWWLLEGGIVWVAGAVAAFAARQEKFSKVLKRSAVRAGMAALCCLALVITKLAPDAIGDVAFGLSVAAALPVLAMLPTPPRPIEVISLASSAISYTLYLMHFPLLSLIVLTGFAPHRLQPSVTAAAVYGILLFLAIVWAATVWWCFERNTGRVYNFLFEYLALGEARGKPIEASKRA
jgi:peptidoglycan/LPS O-acetylase OafA/YrhL